MNLKILSIGFLLILMVSYKAVGQKESNSPIESSLKTFNSMTNGSAKYELDFIDEKYTLYFKYDLGEKKRFGYKAILNDIHPEGIFIIERGDTKYLRILSIHNGKVFVREKFRGQFRNSNNTNIVEIELPDNINKKQLDELIENLKSIFVKEKRNTPIQIVEPPRTKNE